MAVETLADRSLRGKRNTRRSRRKCASKRRRDSREAADVHEPGAGSGAAILSWYKVPTSKLIVLVDDITLDIGRMRVRGRGATAVRTGSVTSSRRSARIFMRIRIGEGKCPPRWDLANWVLSKVSADEAPLLDKALGYVPKRSGC